MLKYRCAVGVDIEYDGVKVTSYAKGLLAAVVAVRKDGEYEEEECFTVNLAGGIDIGNESIPGRYLSFLDTNNSPSVESFFRKYNLGKPYMRFGEPVYAYSGFAEYPLYELNVDVLKQYDPEGCAEYEEHYNRNFEEARKELLSGNGVF